MEEKICSVINSDSFLEFEYEGHHRVVRPYKLFESQEGVISVEAVQVRGTSESGSRPFWRTYNIDKMTSLEETEGPDFVHDSDKVMPDVEDKYNPDDDRYEEVICAKEGFE